MPSCNCGHAQMRLTNLNMLDTKFQRAFVRGDLCVTTNPDSRINPLR